MEEFHQLQKQPKGVSPHKQSKFKEKRINPRTSTGSNICKSKFVGVRQRPSGKWVAEIKDSTQKIRMWLGTFHTPEEAARAYDEAACLLRGANTRTNFATHVSSNSPISIKVRNLLNLKRKSLNLNSSSTLATKTNIKSTTLVVPSFNSSISGSDIFLPNGADVSLLSNDKDDCFPYNNAGTSYSFCNVTKQDGPMFYDAYRPDLSGCTGVLEQANASQLHASWAWRPIGVDQLQVTQEGGDFPRNAGLVSSSSDPDLNEFARITVERQISASLYATNGVNECLENGYDPSDALWDLPTFCQLFCAS